MIEGVLDQAFVQVLNVDSKTRHLVPYLQDSNAMESMKNRNKTERIPELLLTVHGT